MALDIAIDNDEYDFRNLGVTIVREISLLRLAWSHRPVRTELINLGKGNKLCFFSTGISLYCSKLFFLFS